MNRDNREHFTYESIFQRVVLRQQGWMMPSRAMKTSAFVLSYSLADAIVAVGDGADFSDSSVPCSSYTVA